MKDMKRDLYFYRVMAEFEGRGRCAKCRRNKRAQMAHALKLRRYVRRALWGI